MKSVSNKKRILLLTFVFSPNIGGVESHLDDLTKYLAGKGHNVTVITYKPLGNESKIPFKEERKNLTILRIPWFHPAIFNLFEKLPVVQVLYLVPVIFIYSFFYILLNLRKIDVLQVHGFNMTIVGASLSRIYGKPLIINTHVSFYFEKDSRYAAILRIFLRQARRILVLTRESKDELVKIGIPADVVTIYHQWIDEKVFNPKDKFKSRQKLQLDKTKFIALFVGRFSPAKGITSLVEASEKLHKNIQIIFVGSGPLESFITEKSEKISTIKFVGKVRYEDLTYYYSSADIVVIPSTPATKIYSEGIPRVMIEAYRTGIPVVATRAGGVKEHIKASTGFFIRPSAESIAKTVNELAKNPQILDKIGHGARKYALKEFGLVTNAQIIEKSLV